MIEVALIRLRNNEKNRYGSVIQIAKFKIKHADREVT